MLLQTRPSYPQCVCHSRRSLTRQMHRRNVLFDVPSFSLIYEVLNLRGLADKILAYAFSAAFRGQRIIFRAGYYRRLSIDDRLRHRECDPSAVKM